MMASPFTTRDAFLHGAIDRTFGERFTFIAMKVAASGDVNLPRVADATKPDFTCVGVWEAHSLVDFPRARGSFPDDIAPQYTGQRPCVTVQDRFLVWQPGIKCQCRRLFDNSLYEIVRVLPDDRGRMLFVLSGKK